MSEPGFRTWHCWACSAKGMGDGMEHQAACEMLAAETKREVEAATRLRVLAVALNRIQSQDMTATTARDLARQALAEAGQEIWP